MKSHQAKHCEVCQGFFVPDPRVGNRQRVCKQLACQRERCKRSQHDWRAHNPDYFKGRYPEVKAWLEEHPNYLKEYRARKRTAPGQGSLDIQDELTIFKNNVLDAALQEPDIQDEITLMIIMAKLSLVKLGAMIYKTSQPSVIPQVSHS